MLYLRPDNLEFIIHRSTLSYAAMVLIFYIISGQVWNSIRRPPFFHNQPQGGIAFLYPGGDFQFISETIIVMVTYVLVSISILMLVEAGQMEDFGKKRMMAIGGLSLFSIFVSIILSLFRRKYQGYPYSFLLK
ncbi:tumor suppressor candidate 3 [Sparganum proliferum]